VASSTFTQTSAATSTNTCGETLWSWLLRQPPPC
jgi:hypothetical protein